MSLNNLLIVAYYFPPQGGAGTQRFAKFSKYLPEYGFRPIVLTSNAEATTESAPHQDLTLLDEVGHETVIVRVKTDPGVSLSIGKKIGSALKFRVDFEEWVASAIPVANKLIEEHRPVGVLTTVSPYAAAELGSAVARQSGLPWMLDLRDPWALDGWRTHPTAIHACADKRVMLRALRECDHVVANTPASGHAYGKLAKVHGHKVSVIPNGFDPDDFLGLTDHLVAGDLFEMIHVGTLHAADGPKGFSVKQSLRGRLRKVNGLARSARYLLLALARIKQVDPKLFAHFRMKLVGSVHPSNLELAKQLGVHDAIAVEGYRSHRDALAMMAKSDAAFVPLHGLGHGDRSLIVPGKLYEALASKRFVFACLPEGDAADLVRQTNAGVVCSPEDPEQIARELSDLIRQRMFGGQLCGAKRSDLEMFTRRSLTRDLAAVVNQVCLKKPANQIALNPWQKLNNGRRTDVGAAV